MNIADLIHTTFLLWKYKKDEVENNFRRKGDFKTANRYRECRMFNGEESLMELVEKCFSPQGIEFMVNNGFPTKQIFEKFAPYLSDNSGIYINQGNIEISDCKDTILLVGNTHAKISCGLLKSYTIIILHGSSAQIESSGYAVVRIHKDATSSALCHQKENSLIFN